MSFPFIGSQPFSKMYFSTKRRSKIDPELGEMTGTSGTSFETLKQIEIIKNQHSTVNK